MLCTPALAALRMAEQLRVTAPGPLRSSAGPACPAGAGTCVVTAPWRCRLAVFFFCCFSGFSVFPVPEVAFFVCLFALFFVDETLSPTFLHRHFQQPLAGLNRPLHPRQPAAQPHQPPLPLQLEPHRLAVAAELVRLIRPPFLVGLIGTC